MSRFEIDPQSKNYADMESRIRLVRKIFQADFSGTSSFVSLETVEKDIMSEYDLSEYQDYKDKQATGESQ